MKTTEENNKMIAEFMGAILKNSSVFHSLNNKNELWLPIHGICRYDTTQVGNGKILGYHTSWDWLIPVIDKIQSTKQYCEYKNYNSSMVSDGGIDINTKFIEITYYSVVKFIEWYNTNSFKKEEDV